MAEADKKNFAVLSPLKHDGKLYMPVEGKTVKVSLTGEEAEQLAAMGIVGDMPAKADKQA